MFLKLLFVYAKLTFEEKYGCTDLNPPSFAVLIHELKSYILTCLVYLCMVLFMLIIIALLQKTNTENKTSKGYEKEITFAM